MNNHCASTIVSNGRVFKKSEKLIPVDVLTAIIGFDLDMISIDSRVDNIRYKRQIYQYFAFKYTSLTLEQIANLTNRKAHATILNSLNVVADIMETKMPVTIYTTIKQIEDNIENYLKDRNDAYYYMEQAEKFLTYYNAVTGESKSIVS